MCFSKSPDRTELEDLVILLNISIFGKENNSILLFFMYNNRIKPEKMNRLCTPTSRGFEN
jgi:hypothetical protein